VAALSAGFSQWRDSSLDDGYGQGFDGFLRRWGARVAFNGTKQIVGNFAVASLLKQDPRYHPSPRRGVWRRVGHALSRVVVARGDDGSSQFNYSNIVGIGAAAGLSNTWHRDQDSGAAETAARFGLGIAAYVGVKLLQEFIVHRNSPRH
jgi:hypothetical protein